MDIVSEAARELSKRMIAADAELPAAQEALEMLRRWDGTMDRNRPEPLIYATWLNLLTIAVAADEAGTAFPRHWQERELFLQSVLDGENAAWCDDTGTPETETCHDQLSKSLEDAATQLSKKFGEDPRSWRWGDEHIAVFRSQFIGRVPGLAALANVSIETPGGDHTLNRGQSATKDGMAFQHLHGAGYRAVYDLADLSNSRFTMAGGQSGNFLSPHYADLTEEWRDGRYFRSGGRSDAIEDEGNRILLLKPAP